MNSEFTVVPGGLCVHDLLANTVERGKIKFTLVKDTSLARIIGIYEIIWAGESFIKKGLIWPLFYTGAFYLVFSGLLTILFSKLEKKLDYFRG